MENIQNKKSIDCRTSSFIGKVFLYMFLGLLITALVSVGVGLLFTECFPFNYSSESSNQNSYIYIVALISSLFLMFILSFIIRFMSFSKKRSILIPYILYAICVGVLGSAFTMFVDFEVIALSFIAASLTFAIVSLIALTSKRNLNWLFMVVMCLGIGLSISCLGNLLFMLFLPNLYQIYYWYITIGFIVYMTLITLLDVWNIRKTADRVDPSNNVALVCAFNLYTDFIMILLRFIYLFARLLSKKN